MFQAALTRREVIRVAGASLLIGVTGCNVGRKIGQESGEVLVTAGELVVLIPHPLAKVIGVAMVAGGTALKIYFSDKDGQHEEEIHLTPEDQKKLQKAMAEGKPFQVTQPDGTVTTIVPRG